MSHDPHGSGGAGQDAGADRAHGRGHDRRAPLAPIGWTDRPDRVRLFFRLFYAMCAVLLVAELVLGRATEHAHPWEWPPFFYAIYGFLSFWFLVLVARPMRTLLIRSEDYYDE